MDLAETGEGEDTFHRASVYRAIKLLERTGLVRALRKAGEKTLYVPANNVRDGNYLVCRECNSLQDLPPIKEISEIEQRLKDQFQYAGLSHVLEFSGVCEACEPR